MILFLKKSASDNTNDYSLSYIPDITSSSSFTFICKNHFQIIGIRFIKYVLKVLYTTFIGETFCSLHEDESVFDSRDNIFRILLHTQHLAHGSYSLNT